MNRLAILEDNLEFSRKLLNYIVGANKKVQLFSLAIDGEEVWEELNMLEEDDILILDLGLPNRSGLEILESMVQKGKTMPYVIVMSGDPVLIEKAKRYIPYVYTMIEKPFSLHCMVEILEKITYVSQQRDYERRIKKELQKFEMNITTIGYSYVLAAIRLILEDETLIQDMKNKLFCQISIRYNGVDPKNIKWTVEKTVKSLLRYTSKKVLHDYFHAESGEKITTKYFLATVAENIKMQIESLPNHKNVDYNTNSSFVS